MKIRDRIKALGLGGPPIPLGISGKLHEVALGHLLTACFDYKITLIEAVEAVSAGNARYIGVRLEHELDWPRQIRRMCRDAGVAFFYKQSSAIRTEMKTTLDGETIREFPTPRCGQ